MAWTQKVTLTKSPKCPFVADPVDTPGKIYPRSSVRSPTRDIAKKIYLGNRVEISARVNWETQYERGRPLSASKGRPV